MSTEKEERLFRKMELRSKMSPLVSFRVGFQALHACRSAKRLLSMLSIGG